MPNQQITDDLNKLMVTLNLLNIKYVTSLERNIVTISLPTRAIQVQVGDIYIEVKTGDYSTKTKTHMRRHYSIDDFIAEIIKENNRETG